MSTVISKVEGRVADTGPAITQEPDTPQVEQPIQKQIHRLIQKAMLQMEFIPIAHTKTLCRTKTPSGILHQQEPHSRYIPIIGQ